MRKDPERELTARDPLLLSVPLRFDARLGGRLVTVLPAGLLGSAPRFASMLASEAVS